MKILVAEDERASRARIVAYLRAWGHDPIAVDNGEEAWKVLQEEPISLVITDWLMPELDGPGLIRRVRSKPKVDAYTYFIMLTSRTEKEALVEGMEAGADDFIVKPFDQDELRVRIRAGERVIGLEHALAEKNQRLLRVNRRMKKELLAAAAASLVCGCFASASPIALFDFQNAWTGAKEPDFAAFAGNSPSTDPDANSAASLLSNNGFTSGGYLSFSLKDSAVAPTPTTIFSTSTTPDTGMNLGGANQTTATNYVSFTVTPDAGFATTYESLTLFTDTNAAGDQYNVELRAIDGTGAEMVMGSIHSHTPAVVNEPVHFVTFDFADFTSANVTEWRIYAYNTTAAPNGVRFDDITLSGTTSPTAPLAISAIEVDGNLVTLTWNSRPDARYVVKYSTDLTNWDADVVDAIVPDAGDETVFEFDLAAYDLDGFDDLFFRVEEE